MAKQKASKTKKATKSNPQLSRELSRENRVGRELELSLITAAIRSGRHILLEGPVGSGKTFLAHEVIRELKREFVRVDGDGRFTEQKLVGSFDPKLVLSLGFKEKAFIAGPLYEAMKHGKVLLINELNRMPEMVQNVLLPALDENKIQVPNLGEVVAKPGFSVIATQNPREFVGTSALGEAILDRMEWISIQYLSAQEEMEIVRRAAPKLTEELSHAIVLLVRLTRNSAILSGKIRRGASLRAAIALAKLCEGHGVLELSELDQDQFWRLVKMTLANRIELAASKFSAQSYSDLLDETIVLIKEELKKKS